jgi:hypothetical protein
MHRAQNKEKLDMDQQERGWAFGIMNLSGSRELAALALTLVLASGCVLGAEKSVLGRVVQLSAEQGRYSFQFEPREGEPELMPGCRTLDIELHYRFRPETWLPLARGTYPSRKQTDAVVVFLKRALREGREIYLGGDLAPIDKPCTLASHALLLEYRGERELVLSYYGK